MPKIEIPKFKIQAGLGVVLLLLLGPLLLAQQIPGTAVQDLGNPDEILDTSGLGGRAEAGPSGAFRWGAAQVSLPLAPLGYPLAAHLQVFGFRPAGVPGAQLGATVAGQALGVTNLPGQPAALDYRLPSSVLWTVSPRLELTSTTFQPAGDPRILGVQFYRLETSSGPGLPAPWPAAGLLLGGLLAYATAGILRWRQRERLLLVLAWGLALGVLNAVARPGLVYYAWYSLVPSVLLLLLLPWARGAARRRALPPAPEPPPPLLTTRPWPLAAALTGAALLMGTWHVVAPAIPTGTGFTDNLTWGVAFYGALPLPLQALGGLLVITALGAAISAPLPPVAYPRWSALALSGGAMLVFGSLVVKYSEGDSLMLNLLVPRRLWRETELLDFYLKARLWRIVRGLVALPSQVYALVAVVAGGLYVGGAWLLGRTLGRTPRESAVLLGALLTLGNILLFFGYVESYDLLAAASLFVIWACWQYSAGRGGFGTVGALATTTALLHGAALWWGPMVVAAWWSRAARLPPATRWRTARREAGEGICAGLAVVLLVVSVVLIERYDYARLQTALTTMRSNHTFMQLFTTKTRLEHYPFFSWAHLGGVVQEQLLTAPLAVVTLILVVALAGRGWRALLATVPGLGPLTVGTASIFLWSISWNADLGPRQDWDLLSLPAVATSLLAVYLLLRLPPGRARRVALAAYLSVSAVHAAGWITLHILGIPWPVTALPAP